MNTIVKMIFGSRLYGTDTENSDTDYKGIFISDHKDILLQKVPKSIDNSTGKMHIKNTKDDIDTEIYSIHHFFKLASEGQTVAIDMLFAPEDKIIESSLVWKLIVKNRNMFLSKNLKAFVGYCRSQAARYGAKGGRVNALKQFKEILEKVNYVGVKECTLKSIWEYLPINEHSRTYIEPKNSMSIYEVCSKKFESTAKIKYVLTQVNKIYDNYGARAKEAEKSENIDWKAISHAFRVCYEMLEILRDGTVTFPLSDAQFLRELKLGNYHYKNDLIGERLDILLESVELVSKDSTLPDNVNQKEIDDLLYKILYGRFCRDIFPSQSI